MKEQSKIEKLIYDEIGYLPENEDDAVNYLRTFIRMDVGQTEQEIINKWNLRVGLNGGLYKMEMRTIPVKNYWVVCKEDNDLDEEFSASQFSDADDYLCEQRKLWPDKELIMIAIVDA